MATQDDRSRIAAINDATRTPMMRAVFGGPTNKRSQLQKQVAAERPVDAMTGAATTNDSPRPTVGVAAPVRPQNPAAVPIQKAAAAVGDQVGKFVDSAALYRPTNAAEAGDNARRAIGAATAIPIAAAEVATRPIRAGLGALGDFYGGLITGDTAPDAQPVRPMQDVQSGSSSTAPAVAASAISPGAASPATAVRGAVSDQARAQDFVAGNKAPRSDALSINRPIPIPGSDMKYGGQYGDTAVIERPGANGERSFSDTEGVAGANPAMGGIARPGAAAPVQSAGEQLSPAEQFIRNTTMSDGTRAFGGSGSEQLHQARLDALARGDGEAVTRSQMTAVERQDYDKRNAAYDQNPLKAYEIDQVTGADRAQADATAMRNYRNDLLAQAGLGLRQSAAETAADKATASARNASLTQANNIVKTLFPDEPEAGGILGAILEQAVASGNSASLNQLAATEAAKLRAAMARDGFDPGAYLAGYIDQGQPGSDFSAMDDIVPNL